MVRCYQLCVGGFDFVSDQSTFYQFERIEESALFTVMALITAAPIPPKVHQKVAPPPTQGIALFLYSSTRTSMVCQK